MTVDTTFRDFLVKNQAMPPGTTLGHIVWFTVEDAQYDAKHLESEFVRLGLNQDHLPRAINAADAFEKGTKEVDRDHYSVADGKGGTATAEVLVRDVTRNKEFISRHMIREVKDVAGRRLLYDQVGEFIFYRPATRGGKVVPGSERHQAIVAPTVSDSERPVVESILAKFEASYRRHRDFTTASASGPSFGST